MKIKELRLQTHCLDALKTFYVDTLGLPLVYESGQRFTVRVGKSKLTFSRSEEGVEPYYYFKLFVKRNLFEATIRHLKENVKVLDDFESAEAEELVYFIDPGGNIVGCRGVAAQESKGKFIAISEALAGICEVVHAVENTTLFCEYLRQQLNLPVGHHPDSHSVVLGDRSGAIVVTEINRTLLRGQKPVKNFPLALDFF